MNQRYKAGQTVSTHKVFCVKVRLSIQMLIFLVVHFGFFVEKSDSLSRHLLMLQISVLFCRHIRWK